MSHTNRLTLTGIATLFAATLVPLASAQSKTTDDNALAARVKHLEDLEEIRTVLTDYGRFLDACDFSSYSHLFAKDGEWIGGLGTVQGPAAIQAFMEKSIGAANPAHNYHLLSNFEIDVHGDTATAWSAMGLCSSRPRQETRDRPRRPLRRHSCARRRPLEI